MKIADFSGLDALEVAPEPIAGALAVGVHPLAAERRLLVRDFGGGTFASRR